MELSNYPGLQRTSLLLALIVLIPITLGWEGESHRSGFCVHTIILSHALNQSRNRLLYSTHCSKLYTAASMISMYSDCDTANLHKSYWHARYIFPWQKNKNDTKFSKEFIIKIKDRHYRKLTGILPENRTRDYTNRWSTHRLAIFNWLSIGSNLTELSKTSPESSTSPSRWKRKKNEELRQMVLTPTKPTYIRICEN